ncbi:MAG: SDR family oxidoreductase [Prevotella sp.]|nr:SDR family oxidoreductase [Prevotella sp.]
MAVGYNPFSLEGKTILVTGASSGIGRGIAVACSKMGATIILGGRNMERLQETLGMMEGTGHMVCPCDLSDQEEVAKMVEGLTELDGVVHCAGIAQSVLCRQLTEKALDKVMDTNFKAPVLLQAALLKKKKIRQGASIVFIASIASWSPSVGNGAYSASKGAIVSYSKCLSIELAPRNIRVNCISPAMVWTEFALKSGLSEEMLKEDESKYPLKRYGTPEDIAHLAVYMLSDASTWMTGSNVKISGGGKLS